MKQGDMYSITYWISETKWSFSFYFLTLSVKFFSTPPFRTRFISFKSLIGDKWFLLQKVYFIDTFLDKYPFELLFWRYNGTLLPELKRCIHYSVCESRHRVIVEIHVFPKYAVLYHFYHLFDI